MIFTAVIILIALALLGLRDLCCWMGRRIDDHVSRGAEPIEGRGFDARAVTPRIAIVRGDYLTEIHGRGHESEYHQELLKSARRTISKLAFFQRDTAMPQDDTRGMSMAK